MSAIPFGDRVALVVAILAVASVIELAVRGSRAVRWRCAVVILGAGAAGGLLGLLNDAITAWISPEYFAIGKGLGWSAGLHGRACGLGLRAGISAGVVAGCALAYFALKTDPRPAPLRVLWGARYPLLFAVLGATALGVAVLGVAVLGATTSGLAPDSWPDSLGYALEPGARRPFLTVWGAHLGLYVGGLIGLVRSIRRMRGGDRSAQR